MTRTTEPDALARVNMMDRLRKALAPHMIPDRVGSPASEASIVILQVLNAIAFDYGIACAMRHPEWAMKWTTDRQALLRDESVGEFADTINAIVAALPVEETDDGEG